MKILQVIENIDERYGGPAKSVPFLCQHLATSGIEISINSVQRYPVESNSIITNANLNWNNFTNSISDRLRYSPELYSGLEKQLLPGRTIIHTHNFWNFPPYCAAKLARTNRIPFVCSIRGTLYPWSLKQHKFKKIILWHLFQKKALERASCLHVTEKREYEAVRKCGIVSPIAIIPNGIELLEFNSMPTRVKACNIFGLSPKRRYILFLSRIHPSKGLDYLLRAFANAADKYKNWEVLIAGPEEDTNHTKDLKKFIEDNNLVSRVHFLGMLNRKKRIDAYACADLFILPSHSENFGISIAEAMAARIPVITTTATPWQEITSHNCGWRIELSDEKLYQALLEALASSHETLTAKGNRGHDLIKNRYTWTMQANKMARLYNWILESSEKPEFVFSS